MKGYITPMGYMGYVDGRYYLFDYTRRNPMTGNAAVIDITENALDATDTSK